MTVKSSDATQTRLPWIVPHPQITPSPKKVSFINDALSSLVRKKLSVS